MLCFQILLVLFVLGVCVAHTSIDNHPSWQFIPTKTCGRGRPLVRSRIVGGKRAFLGEFPWVARIGERQKTVHGRFYQFTCGGTLISRFYVLTAAHCGTSNNIVRLGENSEIKKNNCDARGCAPPPQDILVQRYFQANYSDATFDNDIMLVQLRRAATFNEFTKPACLPRGEILNLDLVGRELIVAGWGLESNTVSTGSTDLMFAVLPILKNNECDRMYLAATSKDRQICAGFPRGGPDSCAGDSGGPLSKSFGDGPAKRTYVMGIVSYGPEKCGRGPAVYTRVSFYMNWILNSIRK